MLQGIFLKYLYISDKEDRSGKNGIWFAKLFSRKTLLGKSISFLTFNRIFKQIQNKIYPFNQKT